MTKDLGTRILRICQLVYIRDLFEEENLTGYNALIISMKVRSAIEINKRDDYDEADLTIYQWLIGKLMHFACGTRPNIAFVVGRLSKHNANPRIEYFVEGDLVATSVVHNVSAVREPHIAGVREDAGDAHGRDLLEAIFQDGPHFGRELLVE